MARTTSTQRGASRRSASSTTRSGSGGRSATTARTRSKKAAGPSRSSASSRSRAKTSAAARPAGPWVPVLVLGLIVVLGWSLYPALRLQYQASRRMAGLQQQYTSLKQRNQALRAQVAELKTPAGVEKAARVDLGYAKNGENVYVVMPSSSSSKSAGATRAASTSATPGPSVVQTLLDAIFGVQQPASDVAP